jgi:lysozyme
MKTNQAGIDLIKQWEGYKLKAYKDVVGIWTIGYGITEASGLIKITPNLVITKKNADDLLVAALVKYEAAVSKALTRVPNENQFAAYVSLCYNIGPGAFAKSSTVKYFNAGDTAKAANAILLFNKAGGRTVQGLVNRRAAEMKLFLAPVMAPASYPPPDVEFAATGPEFQSERASGWRAWLAGFFK